MSAPTPAIGRDRAPENPYYPAFDLLLAQLLAHEEVLALAESVLATGTPHPTIPTKALGDSGDRRFPGFVADICESQEGRYVRLLPTFRVSDASSDVRPRVLRRCCNWIVRDSYESFQEYAIAIDVRLSEAAPAGGSRLPATPCRLRWGRKGCTCPTSGRRDDLKAALTRIRKAAPALGVCEIRNAREVNLQIWLAVFAGVRNAIAHSSGGIVVPEKLRRLDMVVLDQHFPGTHISEMGYAIEMTPDAARDVIERLREYGLAVYMVASAATGCKAHLLGPDGALTEWRR
jgi:hypothetical protein